MCRRYRLSRRKQVLEEHFDALSDDAEWSSKVQHRSDTVDTRRQAKPKNILIDSFRLASELKICLFSP
jgi:hypothetical protein